MHSILALALGELALHKGNGTRDDDKLFLASELASTCAQTKSGEELINLGQTLRDAKNTQIFKDLGMENDLKTLRAQLDSLPGHSRCWFRVSRQIVERALRVWFRRMSRGGAADATLDAKEEPNYGLFKNTIINLGRNGLPQKNKDRLLEIVYATNPSYHPAQDGKSRLMPASILGKERDVVANYSLKNGALLSICAREELLDALRSPMYWNHIWERYFPLSN